MESSSRNKYSIRKATLNDTQILVSHHCMMFREIWDLQGKNIDDNSCKKLEEADKRKLSEDFPKGLCRAWIVEDKNGKVVASGAISICSFVPTPEDSNYIVAYLHSMYTEKEHRGNGLATMIMKEAENFCRQNNILRIILAASNAGKPVYEKIGFKPSTAFMYKTLNGHPSACYQESNK